MNGFVGLLHSREAITNSENLSNEDKKQSLYLLKEIEYQLDTFSTVFNSTVYISAINSLATAVVEGRSFDSASQKFTESLYGVFDEYPRLKVLITKFFLVLSGQLVVI